MRITSLAKFVGGKRFSVLDFGSCSQFVSSPSVSFGFHVAQRQSDLLQERLDGNYQKLSRTEFRSNAAYDHELLIPIITANMTWR